MSELTLHGYWRSGAAYRVRIALALKGIAYAQVTHDLRTGAQKSGDFRAIAPQGLVPALSHDGRIFTQSPAILEWIEERWPTPPLLPAGVDDRAIVRAMAALIGCDIHPLNNLRVLQAIKGDLGADADQVSGWIGRWIGDGFAALERQVTLHGRGFCHGEAPGLADCYLIPQLYSAERFGVDLAPYPALRAVGDRAGSLPSFQQAHPSAQPDAP